jgi:signal transduction histidine kinase
MLRKRLLPVLTGIILLIAGAIIRQNAHEKQSFQVVLGKLQSFMQERAAALDQQGKELSLARCPEFSDTEMFSTAAAEGLFWFAYTPEDILFWSANTVPVTADIIRNKSDTSIWKLKNGWYIAKRYQGKGFNLLGLALIRNEYSYQNEYLKNGWFGNREFPSIQLHRPDESPADILKWREPLSNNLIYISSSPAPEGADEPDFIDPSHIVTALLTLAGLILLFIGGHIIVTRGRARNNLWWFISLVLIRALGFYFRLPSSFYNLHLFSPADYAASDWLPTLGDLFLNVILLFYGTWLLFRRAPAFNRPLSNLIVFSLLLVLFIGSLAITGLIRGLIAHSSITLDFSDIFTISSSSFIAFLIIVMLFGALFLGAETLRLAIKKSKKSGKKPLLFITVIAAAALVIQPFIPFTESDLILLSGSILLILFLPDQALYPFRYTRIIGLITLFALAGNYLILHDSSVRELEKRKLLALKISAERDPIAESLFKETEDNILSDTLLKSYLRPTTVIPAGQVRDLAQLYFNGYWEKYNIAVNVFGTDECPLTSLYTTPVSDPLVFDRLIDSIGIPTQSGHFFYMDKGSGRISYLARLQIPDTAGNNILGTLYIDFQSRYTPEEIGYPELLLDQMVSSSTDMSSYSYARYKDGSLVSHYGNFSYPLIQEKQAGLKAGNEAFSLVNHNGFEHLYYQASDHSMVILSLPERNFIALLSPFTYLMLIAGLLVLLVLLIQELRTEKKIVLSFKRRIQIFIVGILLFALCMVSAGTLVFLISNNLNKNRQAISEKIHSILVETEYNLYSDESLNPFKSNDLSYLLTRQANIFMADINLYDPSGQLFASSRPKIFEEGLVSKRMQPEALYEMKFRKRTEFIHEEQTGLLQYLSAYVPVRNRENKVIAYLNLPYFARQSELKREISVFLVTIINIYVLLMVLVVIAAIFLSNRITEPLRLIQERLGRIRLGRQNEVIAWKGNDEIARLINEYNSMVEQLANSAEKLARSERESAWREMAKQVAHEIKNPLTPIKLSIQHLNRAWHDKAPDFELRLERFSKTLIEQIDTLSHIATAFSNFAQMPRMAVEKVDLHEMLGNLVDFFSAESQIKISYSTDEQGKCLVMSDREQLLRAFNNLIRNAIQSIEPGKTGKINVHLEREENFWVVSITDNGSGIPDEIREKIFYPNFTTRTGGMGLGLALVKSIIESSGGTVSFSSVLSAGSTFFVRLPAYHQSEL